MLCFSSKSYLWFNVHLAIGHTPFRHLLLRHPHHSERCVKLIDQKCIRNFIMDHPRKKTLDRFRRTTSMGSGRRNVSKPIVSLVDSMGRVKLKSCTAYTVGVNRRRICTCWS